MNFTGPVLLAEEYNIEHFHSGVDALDIWIKTRARPNQVSGVSRTWVILDNHSVVAFYASASAAVVRNSVSKAMRRNQPDMLPAVLLSRLAVHSDYQGQGLAASLLKHFMLKAFEVSERIGVRVVLVHAKDNNARSFYLKYGFVQSPFDSLTLFHLLPSSLGKS